MLFTHENHRLQQEIHNGTAGAIVMQEKQELSGRELEKA
jgi:hypothetical protein